MSKSSLIIVSNRLPVRVRKEGGKWSAVPSSGGLATALAGIRPELEFKWVGWPGAVIPGADEEGIRDLFAPFRFVPVFLCEEETDRFYNGFCNSVLWPLFHYLPGRVDFSLPYWEDYVAVNERFAKELIPLCSEDSTIWVHDYHLFLLPQMLRDRLPRLRIGFFLHIPWPSSELYRQLAVRREVLSGILGSDLVGFHTHDYCHHFSSSCLRVLGAETTATEIRYNNRRIALGSYPIGISPGSFIDALKKDDVIAKREILEKQYAGLRVILGVDRADYSKGLVHKLQAYERFLETHPEWRGKTVFVQVAVPSRTMVNEYQALKKEVDQWVGKINGRFGSPGYAPIHYMAQEVAFDDLCALYELADVCLVTSVRDGMNLVSLEYVACQRERNGVLVLSEFAGAARSLPSALLINPWDLGGVADTLHRALTMDERERLHRTRTNLNFVMNFQSLGWARHFLRDLASGTGTSSEAVSLWTDYAQLKREFVRAEKRAIFLDYDGTLVGFQNDPSATEPPEEVRRLLMTLSGDPGNDVFIVSGRMKGQLERWFEGVRIGLAAEHGMFLKAPGAASWETVQPVDLDWKASVRPLLEDHVKRAPGSFLEEKETSLAWHYRRLDEEFGEWQALELLIFLEKTLANLPVCVSQSKKVVEVRPVGIDKGRLVMHLLSNVIPSQSPLVLCFGDDRTDEDMFDALPPTAWTCRVGDRNTRARYFLPGPDDCRDFLTELISP